MGGCLSSETKRAMKEAKKRDLELTKEQEAQAAIDEKTVNLLLLGAGESGKSTIVKQMKIIHGAGYTKTELESYKATIVDNLIASMVAVMKAMLQLKINLGDQGNRVHVATVLKAVRAGDTVLPETLAVSIKALWRDTGVQQCYARRNEYQLNDSARYYFDAIDRIATPGFSPSQQDVLRARVKTTGVLETSFEFKDMYFKITDVGGQRSERRKWMPAFENVKALIFVTALSGYDLMLEEKDTVNRIEESLELFDGVVNNRFFKDTSIILFMNKTDLFAEKIKRSPIKKYFPDYTGPEGDLRSAQEFFRDKFLAKNRSETKKIYTHFTCATDTTNFATVFNAVTDIIERDFMASIGLG